MNDRPTIIWQIHDGKPGHRNQLRGLTNALAKIVPIEVHSMEAPSRRSSLGAFFSRRFLPGKNLPRPNLILGAGHATHLAVLAAKRACGGRTVILMKPTLPTRLFNLCIVPEHDGVANSGNVVTTRGVLNVVRPSTRHDSSAGLLLIGGPSAAHGWSNDRMIEQILAVVHSDPEIQWHLTTSRRTPASFLPELGQRVVDNLTITPHERTEATWVPNRLASTSQVWVSADSVSMVYEALTSGAAVGILEVPSEKLGRVAAGMQKLVVEGWVTEFSGWQPGNRLDFPREQLDEASRCARLVYDRLCVTPLSEAS